MSDWNDSIIADFRANDGQITSGPMEGATLLLLTTTGAKSGEKRTAPVAYFPQSEDRLVVASKAGAPDNPAWYHNLLLDPKVHVEASSPDGIDEYDAIAEPIPEPQRTERYAEIAALNPGFAAYQQKTDRLIPLVVLRRR